MGEFFGYARVSTRDQNLEGQVERLKASGVPEENVYMDKWTGSTADRPQLRDLLKILRRGDTLIITKLDRLGRSVFDLLNITNKLKEKKVDLRVLDQQIDTGTSSGKLLMHMLMIIAEFEREMIQERADEGRRRAQAAGVQFGVNSKFNAKQLAELREAFAQPGSNKSELARQLGVSRSTLYRLATGPDPKNIRTTTD